MKNTQLLVISFHKLNFILATNRNKFLDTEKKRTPADGLGWGERGDGVIAKPKSPVRRSHGTVQDGTGDAACHVPMSVYGVSRACFVTYVNV